MTGSRGALYARISKTDVNVPKVANQLASLRKLAAERGYAVVAEYSDDGISGSTGEERPDFERLMQDMAEAAFDVILATESERFVRNNLENQFFIAASAAAGVTWDLLRGGQIDPADEAGEFTATVFGAFSSMETKRKAKRQREAAAIVRASGVPRRSGQRPFGYLEDKLTLHPEESALIRTAIDMLLGGSARWDVVMLFNESGFTTVRGKTGWSSTQVYQLLKRARNANLMEHEPIIPGKRTSRGKYQARGPAEIIGSGTWDPICSEDELFRVRAILDNKIRATSGKRPVTMLSGIPKCRCGRVMYANGARGAGHTYRCKSMLIADQRKDTTGPHVSFKVAVLDRLVRDALIDHFWRGAPTTGAAREEAATVSDLHEGVKAARVDIETLGRALGDGMPYETWRKLNAEAVARRDELIKRLEILASESAIAAMQVQIQVGFLRDLSLPLGGEYAIGGSLDGVTNPFREGLAEAFDGLSVDRQQALIRWTLAITVGPGRGPGRVTITPL